jgi:hypothetical protein
MVSIRPHQFNSLDSEGHIQVKFLWSEVAVGKKIIKTLTSGISEQQEENSMIFPKVTFRPKKIAVVPLTNPL